MRIFSVLIRGSDEDSEWLVNAKTALDAANTYIRASENEDLSVGDETFAEAETLVVYEMPQHLDRAGIIAWSDVKREEFPLSDIPAFIAARKRGWLSDFDFKMEDRGLEP